MIEYHTDLVYYLVPRKSYHHVKSNTLTTKDYAISFIHSCLVLIPTVFFSSNPLASSFDATKGHVDRGFFSGLELQEPP